MSAFIDEHRAFRGRGHLCQTLGVSASAHYQRATGERSDRAVGDERLLAEICCVHKANYERYGSRRVYKQPRNRVARCTVERLMARAWDPESQAPRQAVAYDQARPGLSR